MNLVERVALRYLEAAVPKSPAADVHLHEPLGPGVLEHVEAAGKEFGITITPESSHKLLVQGPEGLKEKEFVKAFDRAWGRATLKVQEATQIAWGKHLHVHPEAAGPQGYKEWLAQQPPSGLGSALHRPKLDLRRTTQRQQGTGRYIHTKPTRLCVCGHPVGVHSAEKGADGSQPCFISDYLDVSCPCEKLRPTNKFLSDEDYARLTKHAAVNPSLYSPGEMDKLAYIVAARFGWGPGNLSIDPLAERVAAKYKNKKKVKTEGGKEMTVYQYSDRQVANRNKKKAERIEALRKSIGGLRKKMKRDLKSSDPETSMTALAVALIDHTYERVGGERGAEEGHYGVTGWKKKHVTFGPKDATIKYVGKSGVKHEKKVSDAGIKQALRNAYEACDGKDNCLFEGDWGSVSAEKVNEYLSDFDITAKDIRGFHANREMQERLKARRAAGKDLPSEKKAREKLLKTEFLKALDETAEAVGHEPSTLRSQYLVPGMEESYMKDGTVSSKLSSVLDVDDVGSLEERLAARFLLDLL
jgi:hypothetical protein